MDSDQDKWQELKPVIRRLYIVEGRPLKEVKEILERDYGFPTLSMWHYEIQLRDVFGFRKKLKAKAGDWHRIYHYARAHGYANFDVRLNGKLIPTKTLRKEIHRSGAFKSTTPVNGSILLPDGVQVQEQPGSLFPQQERFDSRRLVRSPVFSLTLTPGMPSASQRAAPEGVISPGSVAQNNAFLLDMSPQVVAPEQSMSLVPALASRSPPFSPLGYVPMGLDNLFFLDSLNTSQPSSFPIRPSSGPSRDVRLAGSISDASLLLQRPPSSNAMGFLQQGTPTLELAVRGTSPTTQAFCTATPKQISRFFLEGIPWFQYRMELQAMRTGTSQAPYNFREVNGLSIALAIPDSFSYDASGGQLVPISDAGFPSFHDLRDWASPSGALSTQFDPYHFLGQVVYLVSNNLHQGRGGDDNLAIRLLDMMVKRVRKDLLIAIFKSAQTSMRAVWENLFDTAFGHRLEKGLMLLIDIGLEIRAEWVLTRRDEMLLAALRTGSAERVQMLLDEGAWLEVYDPTSSISTGFSLAAAYGAIDCARLLAARCQLNKALANGFTKNTWSRTTTTTTTTIFVMFIFEVCHEFRTRSKGRRHGSDPQGALGAYLEVLTLLLQAGADVYTPVPLGYESRLHAAWPMTCLYVCYYVHRSLFDRLLPYCPDWRSRLTRAGVFEAFLHGRESLADFLDSVPNPGGLTADDCMQVMLAEQFAMGIVSFESSINIWPMTTIQAGIARVLVERGVDLIELALETRKNKTNILGKTFVLETVLRTAMLQGLSRDLRFLIEWLTSEGILVSRKALGTCIGPAGTEVLEALIRLDANVADYGAALLMAATQANYNAIALLLRAGADINSGILREFPQREIRRPRTILATLLIDPGPVAERLEQIKDMWRYLVEHGAKLRLYPGNSNCYPLLEEIVHRSRLPMGLESTWHAFEFVLRSEHLDHWPRTRWAKLLELSISKSLDWRICKALLQRGGPAAQPMLAVSIALGCEEEFVDHLLTMGEDINDASTGRTPLRAAARRLNTDLVQKLIQRGARLHPVEDRHILQDVYRRTGSTDHLDGDQPSSDRWNRQEQLIRLLVDHGADVNAPPEEDQGRTALQLVCERKPEDRMEELHLLRQLHLLLSLGAHVNAPASWANPTAIQACARNGDLEKAEILVQHDADMNGDPSFNFNFNEWASALDLAAAHGRLDMTQFLLNLGALSADLGTTGYRGAVHAARRSRHYAVADVIDAFSKRLTSLYLEPAAAGLKDAHQERMRTCAASTQKMKAELDRVMVEWLGERWVVGS